ncbi:MAG: hypothetical protein ACP5HD_10825 [Thermoproteus sp.]
MLLATYLPFYRLHEVELYFLKNVEALRPKAAVVYLDNVYREEQRKIVERIAPPGVEIKTGNWRNRNDTWLYMLRDFETYTGDWLVVDSDNVVEPHLAEAHGELRGRSPIYTVLDEEAWSRSPRNFLARSRPAGTAAGRPVYSYKVYDGSWRGLLRGGSLYFIGPKQVVAFSKLFDREVVERVGRALSRVDVWLRNFISDETLLGVLAHLSGIEEVPWIVASHHYHHGSAPGRATKIYVAAAHYQFAKALGREFGGFLRYRTKYMLSALKNLRYLLTS